MWPTGNGKLDGKGRRRRTEAELRAAAAASVVIRCGGVQWTNLDVVNLAGAVKEVVILITLSGGGGVVFSGRFAVLNN